MKLRRCSGVLLLLVLLAPSLAGCEILAYALYKKTQLPATNRSQCDAAEEACRERGIDEACTTIADCYRSGRGRRRDVELAYRFDQRACEGGYTQTCVEMAQRHADGKGAPRDPAQALSLLERACRYGRPDACIELGRVFERGDARYGTPGDPPRALAAYQRACWIYAQSIEGCIHAERVMEAMREATPKRAAP